MGKLDKVPGPGDIEAGDSLYLHSYRKMTFLIPRNSRRPALAYPKSSRAIFLDLPLASSALYPTLPYLFLPTSLHQPGEDGGHSPSGRKREKFPAASRNATSSEQHRLSRSDYASVGILCCALLPVCLYRESLKCLVDIIKARVCLILLGDMH